MPGTPRDDPHADAPGGAPEIFYIGRGTVEGTQKEPRVNSSDYLVIDHRSPIASLYYRYDGVGPRRYDAYGKSIDVEIRGKRRHDIQTRSLRAVYDGDGLRIDLADTLPVAKSVTDPDPVAEETAAAREPLRHERDPLLGELLTGRHARARMADIVEFIQAEQDEIIRDPRPVLLVQGPAGSGKTICALQRAAQILYDRRMAARGGAGSRRALLAQDILLLTPSAAFSDYVSRVLPGMNEDGLTQLVFEDVLIARARRRLQYSARTARAILRDEAPPSIAEAEIGGEEAGSTESDGVRAVPFRLERRRERAEALLAPDRDPAREAGAALKADVALLPRLEAFAATVADALIECLPARDIRLANYYGPDGGERGVFFARERVAERIRHDVGRGVAPVVAWERAFAAVRERFDQFKAAARAFDDGTVEIPVWRRPTTGRSSWCRCRWRRGWSSTL